MGPGTRRRLIEVGGREVAISNFEKVLFGGPPAPGFTKGDLVSYYVAVAEWVLPHLAGRGLTMKRYPDGVAAEHFYEKRAPSHRPAWVSVVPVGGVEYVLVDGAATLAWLGGLACVELHTPMARAASYGVPTMVVFDLDPGEGVGLGECCEVALVLRGLFEGLGLVSVCKTSGSKGLQVYVPLNGGPPTPGGAGLTHEAARTFAREVARAVESRMGELVVSNMTRARRRGRVLVDWSQNSRHKTTVCAYSVRAVEGGPWVSAPVSWEEVSAAFEGGEAESALRFSPADVLERVAAGGDLFAPALEVVQELPAL